MILLNLGKRKKFHGTRLSEQRGCSRIAMLLSVRICQMFRVLWTGALSLCSNHDLFCHNSCQFSHTKQSICHRILKTHWLIICTFHKNSLWTMFHRLKNITNMNFTALFSSASAMSETSTACSGSWFFMSYWKIYVSLPVMTLWSKSASVWRHLMKSWLTCMHHSFWSSFSILHTIFVQTFQVPKSSVIIFPTLFFFFMSHWLVVIWTVNWELSHTICLVWHWPQSCLFKAFCFWSHLSPSHTPLWITCATQKHMHNMVLSPYNYWNISSACDGVFSNQTKNFRFICCLVFIIHSFLNTQSWTIWKRGVNKSM